MEFYGTGVQRRESYHAHVHIIDGRNATISAKVPDAREMRIAEENYIYTNPADLISILKRSRAGAGDVLPSLSLLRFAKVKAFIDGVYAALEERIGEKGHPLSRPDFLSAAHSFFPDEEMSAARQYLQAARTRDTRGEPSMSLPQGFYDWAPALRDAYQQIKICARRPGFFSGREGDDAFNAHVVDTIRRFVRTNPSLQATYERLTELYARLTGKPDGTPALFPSARLPDQEFFAALSKETQSDIPGGLGNALVEALKHGRLAVAPSNDAGLYLRQLFEIVPLLTRDTEEFAKFLPDDTYAAILEREFISQWAVTRHTHVGHSPFGRLLVGGVVPPMGICPDLSIEPFPTVYDRMAASLNFFEATLKAFTPDVLDRKRPRQDGSTAPLSIGEEFETMYSLLAGFSALARDSIHLPYQTGRAEETSKYALAWLEGMTDDPDVNRNTALFVPLIRTTDGACQISSLVAGFTLVPVEVSYNAKPQVTVKDDGRGYTFKATTYLLPVLVHREVRVSYKNLLNDRRLHALLPRSFTEADLDTVVQRLEGN